MTNMFLSYPILQDLKNEQIQAIKEFQNSEHTQYEKINCPLCESDRYKVLFKNDRYGIKQQTVLCKNCGLVYSNPRLTEESTNYFYNSDLYRNIYGGIDDIKAYANTKYNRNYNCNKQKPEFKAYYPEIFFEFINSQQIDYKTVCDIGCGGGWNLVPFNKIGKPTIGFEPSPTLVEIGKQADLNLIEGFVDEIEGEFDLIILTHVLEHFIDPMATLKQLRLHCKKYIAIEVPGFIDKIPSIQNAHNFYFSKNTLRRTVEKTGFRMIDLQFCDDNNFIMALFEKNDGTKFDYTKQEEVIKQREIYKKYIKRSLVVTLLKKVKLHRNQ